MLIWTQSQKIVLPVALLIIVLVTLAIYFITKNKSSKIKRLPLLVIAVVLLVMEVTKQILAIPDYSLWNIPLHFCSAFMFWFALATFAKPGKWSEIGFTMSMVFGFWFLALFYINPQSVIGGSTNNILQDFGAFHTFVYHHLMILFILLAPLLGQYKPKLKHALWVVILYSTYALVAMALAHTLQVNFVNLLQSNIPFMQALNERFGIVVYSVIMFSAGLIGCLAGLFASIGVQKLFKSKSMLSRQKTVTLNKSVIT